LNNLLAALRAMSAMEAAPSRPGDSFFWQIDNLASLDAARANYYREEHSRRVFDWMQQYRVVMSFYGEPIPVQLHNTPFDEEEWARLEQQASAMTPHILDDNPLDRIDTWILESYALKGECEALPGDVVLDCGAYTGNTAMYFSQKTGVSGHVYGFEAVNSTFEKFTRNMRGLENVTPVHAAVSNATGTLLFSGNNGCSRMDANGEEEVPAITLDEFCRSRNLAKVDFIKMDIEGAEDAALEGATDLIRRHRPKMAIAAYHSPCDVFSLPARILAIAPYSFKLRHYSPFSCETVLYCIPSHAETDSPLPEPTVSSRQYTELLFLLLPLMRKILTQRIMVPLVQQHDMFRAFGAATQGMRQLMEDSERLGASMNQLIEDNKHLGAENAALRKMLERHGTKRDT
jgi:FkbM family methyltransferase